MSRYFGLFLLSAAASGLCWFPMQMDPNFGWPLWIPVTVLLISAASCGALMRGDAAQDYAKVRSNYTGPDFSSEEWKGLTMNWMRRWS